MMGGCVFNNAVTSHVSVFESCTWLVGVNW